MNNTEHIYKLIELCHSKGVSHAVVCPGSRCAPLLLGFGTHPEIETVSVTDERSAGFIGLGLAQETGKPVAVVCTSGTAALNFAPAVTEAFYQNVPLIVLTADRPPELIDQWNNQTIHQEDIFANHLQGFLTYTKDNYSQVEKLLPRSGPVHINIPISEPFYPKDITEIKFNVQPVDNSNPELQTIDESVWEELQALLSDSDDAMILAGQMEPCPELVDILEEIDIPIAGDIASNLQPINRCVRTVDVTSTPKFLLTIGRSIVSKKLRLFLRDNKPEVHWHIGRGMVGDPFQSLTKIIAVDPEIFFAEFARRGFHGKGPDLNRKAVNLSDHEFNSLTAVEKILSTLPENGSLHIGNGMAVRLADLLGVIGRDIEVWSNRGTSGIDGVVSAAVGHALGSNKQHTLIVGDLSFFYDRNGLWLNHEYPQNLRIIILNDGGGGTFNMISGPSDHRELTDLFTVPHSRTAELTAKEFGLKYMTASSLSEIDLESFDSGILEIFTEMETDAKVYRTEANR